MEALGDMLLLGTSQGNLFVYKLKLEENAAELIEILEIYQHKIDSILID